MISLYLPQILLGPDPYILRDTYLWVGLPDSMPTVDPAQHPHFFDPEEWLSFTHFDENFEPYEIIWCLVTQYLPEAVLVENMKI